jgi:hypothetical protein
VLDITWPCYTTTLLRDNSKEKWTAYKFTKDIYDIWMPTHVKRICSVIDKLPPSPPPNLDFQVSQQSEPWEFGLSQGLESHPLSDQSSHGVASLLEDNDKPAGLCCFARYHLRHVRISKNRTESIREAKEKEAGCRNATVTSLSSHVLFATKGFGKAVQYNDATEANESVTYSLPFLSVFRPMHLAP